MPVGLLDGLVALGDLASLVGWAKGDPFPEATKMHLVEATLFVLTADGKLTDDEIAFLNDESDLTPDDFGRALDEVRSELDGLDQRGRARFCKGLAHRMSAAEQAVQTRILVAAGLAASVDRDGRAAQRAAYEQLVEAAGADRDAIDLEVRVRTQLE